MVASLDVLVLLPFWCTNPSGVPALLVYQPSGVPALLVYQPFSCISLLVYHCVHFTVILLKAVA